MKHKSKPLNKQLAIGKKIEIIPDHLTKILYREGEGSFPNIGDKVCCQYIVYKSNGKQLDNRLNNQVQFPVGIGRLIEGLQLALMQSKKNEKFTLIISPEYGYKYVKISKDQEENLNQKLFVEMNITNILPKGTNNTQLDSLILLHEKYKEVNQLLSQGKQQEAISLLKYYSEANLNGISRHSSCAIKVFFIQKWISILMTQGQFKEALQINKQCQTFSFDHHLYLYRIAQIYYQLGDQENSQHHINKYYSLYAVRDGQKKRRYVEFMKKFGRRALKKSSRIQHRIRFNIENLLKQF